MYLLYLQTINNLLLTLVTMRIIHYKDTLMLKNNATTYTTISFYYLLFLLLLLINMLQITLLQ